MASKIFNTFVLRATIRNLHIKFGVSSSYHLWDSSVNTDRRTGL